MCVILVLSLVLKGDVVHVLITGGAGFIGSNLALYHLKQGDMVHVVDDLSTGSLNNLKSCINNDCFVFDEADLLNWDSLDSAVEWADRIYHLAAVVGVFRVLKEPISVLETNIGACERLLRSLHKSHWNTKLIVASTSEVYGSRHENIPLHEELELIVNPGHNTRWNYSISKLADEAFSVSYAREYNMNITIVRLFNVVGPHQTGKYGMVLPRFVKQAVKGEPITVYGDGSQVRSFMDINDCINMLQLLCENEDTKGEIVNIGTSHEIKIKELASTVKRLANSQSEIVYIPYDKAYGTDFEEIYHRKPDLTKLNRFTGYSPKLTLEDTISRLIDIKSKE